MGSCLRGLTDMSAEALGGGTAPARQEAEIALLPHEDTGGEVPASLGVGSTGQEQRSETSSMAASEPAPQWAGQQIARVESLIDALTAKLDELVRLGDRRERMIDRLHAENQRLRGGELRQAQAPVIRELIRTYDLVVTLAAQEGSAQTDLELVRRRLLDGVELFGVRPIEVGVDADFDATQHAAVARATTSDRAFDMTVARATRVGFVQDDGHVLRPTDVAVRRYSAPLHAGGSSVEGQPEQDQPE
jgi:molecular chaperone GrpE (heat shock protein)